MRELSLFSGVGGGLLATRLLGWTTVCAVELRFQGYRVPGPLRSFQYALEQEEALTVESGGVAGTTYVGLAGVA